MYSVSTKRILPDELVAFLYERRQNLPWRFFCTSVAVRHVLCRRMIGKHQLPAINLNVCDHTVPRHLAQWLGSVVLFSKETNAGLLCTLRGNNLKFNCPTQNIKPLKWIINILQVLSLLSGWVANEKISIYRKVWVDVPKRPTQMDCLRHEPLIKETQRWAHLSS